MFIYAYNNASKAGKQIRDMLNVKFIKHKNSKFKGSPDKVVINWGSSNLPEEVLKCTVVNTSVAVSRAANKRSFFEAMVGHARTPEFTTDKAEALKWVDDGNTVVCRTLLNANSGKGIVLVEPGGGELVDAPLYTKYVPKKQEWRIHVFRGECVDIQRKARKKDVPNDEVNWKIRNIGGGFIFARNEGIKPHEDIIEQAIKAVEACGLDFGAADVIFNEKEQQAYVLEVNTAPGVDGTTLEGYVKRFEELK
ncbi:hypothetical protein FBPa8_0029 [Pseudomonas phage vB_PaeP_FBPa8]|uniref:ATP-grasp fold RimK-type domain-containing protein n=1 Tax=Variovorax paradoxus TaxID=34073 RepID=A0A2W5SEQ3_VARPD|nr:MAG: hypothetical protein DI563_01730 [Variovorax paradoxus]UVN13493.1 hypothetical protein FBPa8_0029 [Pseudomonas phage vB_PaeP_FBPa8]